VVYIAVLYSALPFNITLKSRNITPMLKYFAKLSNVFMYQTTTAYNFTIILKTIVAIESRYK